MKMKTYSFELKRNSDGYTFQMAFWSNNKEMCTEVINKMYNTDHGISFIKSAVRRYTGSFELIG